MRHSDLIVLWTLGDPPIIATPVFIQQFNSANKVNSTCRSYITRSLRSTVQFFFVYTSLPQRRVKPHAAWPIRKCLAATKLPGRWGNCVSSVFFFIFSSNFTFLIICYAKYFGEFKSITSIQYGLSNPANPMQPQPRPAQLTIGAGRFFAPQGANGRLKTGRFDRED